MSEVKQSLNLVSIQSRNAYPKGEATMIRSMTKRIFTPAAIVCAAAVAAIGTGATVQAAVVHDTIGQASAYTDQQYGNDEYYIGDTITPSQAGLTVTTIVIPFMMTYYNRSNTDTTPFTYTPHVRLGVYSTAADAALNNGTGLLGTASVNNVSFTDDGHIDSGSTLHFNFEDQQNLTFDFSGQNISTSSSFAIAYHDDGADGSLGANGFSDLEYSSSTATGYFDTYPNSATGAVLESYPGFRYSIAGQRRTRAHQHAAAGVGGGAAAGTPTPAGSVIRIGRHSTADGTVAWIRIALIHAIRVLG